MALSYLPSWPYCLFWLSLAVTVALVIVLVLYHALATSQYTTVPKCRAKGTPAHLLVVLGSGGHTAEMFSMLRRMRLDPSVYTYRTYVVSSGDNFSAAKAAEFEKGLIHRQGSEKQTQDEAADESTGDAFSIVTVPRARRVHQSYLTAPFSTLQCFWSCLLALQGLHPDQMTFRPVNSPYPDLILTNGPATAVCVILAARALRLFHYMVAICSGSANPQPMKKGQVPPDLRMRTIFVESWARVTTLSLSGKILLPFVDRFLVQWPALEGKKAWRCMRKTEYVGALVD